MPQIANQRSVAAEIEREHAELNRRLRQLHEMMPCRPGDEACAECGHASPETCWELLNDFFADVIDYMREHFRREEMVMRHLHDAPVVMASFEAHAEAHADMMERVTRMLTGPGFREQRLGAIRFIEDWLADHLAGHDGALLRRLKGGAG